MGFACFHIKPILQMFPGNSNTYDTVKNVLRPPIIASRLRFVPFSDHPRTVCMRVEVHGCNYTGKSDTNWYYALYLSSKPFLLSCKDRCWTMVPAESAIIMPMSLGERKILPFLQGVVFAQLVLNYLRGLPRKKSAAIICSIIFLFLPAKFMTWALPQGQHSITCENN